MFVALFFLLALFFAPLAGMVPAYASAAALLYVACVMARGFADGESQTMIERIKASVVQTEVPAGATVAEIKDLCQFDLDVSRVAGETTPPTREELHFIHDVLDPDQIFIPKVKQG